MLRRNATLLGIGLLVLWVAGLGAPEASPWLTWLDGTAALFSFLAAIYGPRQREKGTRVLGVATLASALFVLWIVGLAAGVPRWQAWWTFAFGCAFLALAVGCAREKRPTLVENASDFERDKFRRGA